MTTIDVNGTRVHYELHGDANASVIALCHSLGTSLSLWDRQVDALSGEYRILRYDLRGHGRSAVTPGPYSVEQLADDFIALLDALGIARVDFCGVSLGGLIGQWLGARAPDRISHLVLANTAARLGTTEGWNARIAGVREAGLASFADGGLGRWFTAPFIAREPAVVAGFRETLVSMSPDAYVASVAAIRDADHRSLVGEIDRPTLVVAGAFDLVTTTDDAAWLAAHIPNATMLTLPAAHLANAEAFAEFNAAVRTFVSTMAMEV